VGTRSSLDATSEVGASGGEPGVFQETGRAATNVWAVLATRLPTLRAVCRSAPWTESGPRSFHDCAPAPRSETRRLSSWSVDVVVFPPPNLFGQHPRQWTARFALIVERHSLGGYWAEPNNVGGPAGSGASEGEKICNNRLESHHLVITFNRDGLDLSAYDRRQRTARFPVNTRESASFGDVQVWSRNRSEPSRGRGFKSSQPVHVVSETQAGTLFGCPFPPPRGPCLSRGRSRAARDQSPVSALTCGRPSTGQAAGIPQLSSRLRE
jgi:hypothetical protein